MTMIMKDIKYLSKNILEWGESLLQFNVTTYEVNAVLAISAGLSQGYEILKKIFEKGAASQNSISNINTIDLNINQVQYTGCIAAVLNLIGVSCFECASVTVSARACLHLLKASRVCPGSKPADRYFRTV